MPDLSFVVEVLLMGVRLFLSLWWVWVPLMLANIAYDKWAAFVRARYLASLRWVYLEVIPPPDVQRSPLAAEYMFAGLHSTYGGGIKWKDEFVAGKVPDWFSMELVSTGGGIHFFIRCPEGHRNTIESLIFAQYPDAEIRVTEDYTNQLPAEWDPAQYDLSGSEYEFAQPDAYAIRTWRDFEEAGGKDENSRIDPLSPLFEMMGMLQPGEQLWLHFVMRPTGGDWVKAGQAVVDKLIGKEPKAPEPTLAQRVIGFPFMLLEEVFYGLGILQKAEEKKKEEKPFSSGNLTPMQKAILEDVERKLSKPAFKVTVRATYIARKDAFNGTRMAGVNAMFKQVFFNNYNGFKPGAGTRDKGSYAWLFPSGKGFGADEATASKKKKFYGAARARTFGGKLVILNTEEMATLWHLPGLSARAPLLPRVQSKKGMPPSYLPTR